MNLFDCLFKAKKTNEYHNHTEPYQFNNNLPDRSSRGTRNGDI